MKASRRRALRIARRFIQSVAANRCVSHGLTYAGRAYEAKANVGERSVWFLSAVTIGRRLRA